MAAKKSQKKTKEDKIVPFVGGHDHFFGYEAMERSLRAELLSDRLHHAWLIEGMRGLGKATLAWRMARFLLNSDPLPQGLAIDKNSQTWHLTLAMSHPDFLVITPAAEQKTATITVDNIRFVQDFFSKSPALGRHRICIIDAVDNMNLNAANALLKLLEEPPDHGVFFLISHNSGGVPATIRSRCRCLKLSPLPDDNVGQIIKFLIPQVKEKDQKIAIRLAHGCPGRAIAFAQGDGRKLYHDLHKLIAGLPQMDDTAMQNFCASLTSANPTGDRNEKYALFCDLIIDWISSGVVSCAEDPAQLNQRLLLWDKISDIVQTQQRLNMDRGQAALRMLLAIEEAVQ